MSDPSRDNKNLFDVDLFDYNPLFKEMDPKINIHQVNSSFDPHVIAFFENCIAENPVKEVARPSLIRYGPQTGNDKSAVLTVIFEHPQEANPMKIVFGDFLLEETTQHQRSLSNSDKFSITLVAKVPPLHKTGSAVNPVKIMVRMFDQSDSSLVIDTWNIGEFTYIDYEEDTRDNYRRKRPVSCEPDNISAKRTTHIVQENLGNFGDFHMQLMQMMTSYDLPSSSQPNFQSYAAPVINDTNVDLSYAYNWSSPSSSDDTSSSGSQSKVASSVKFDLTGSTPSVSMPFESMTSVPSNPTSNESMNFVPSTSMPFGSMNYLPTVSISSDDTSSSGSQSKVASSVQFEPPGSTPSVSMPFESMTGDPSIPTSNELMNFVPSTSMPFDSMNSFPAMSNSFDSTNGIPATSVTCESMSVPSHSTPNEWMDSTPAMSVPFDSKTSIPSNYTPNEWMNSVAATSMQFEPMTSVHSNSTANGLGNYFTPMSSMPFESTTSCLSNSAPSELANSAPSTTLSYDSMSSVPVNFTPKTDNDQHQINTNLTETADYQRQYQHQCQYESQQWQSRSPAIGYNHEYDKSYQNPYSISCVVNKIQIKLNGNLLDLMQNWSSAEHQAGRRLVQFWRKTTSSPDGQLTNVEAGFKAIGQQEYQEQRMRDSVAAIGAYNSAIASDSMIAPLLNAKGSSIVISCIYWPEKNDCFITSVDCINLIEGLIGNAFSVDEKNRVRRNLEGFRPFTVSRGGESTDFFKRIMGYPHPRPRNIEKDVKVYSWRLLQFALRKVLRKYTLSFTSIME